MANHTEDSLAEALYEGYPTLFNLAEEMARQYGKSEALSFFGVIGEDVQWFWRDIARQIIKHSSEWEEKNGSCCVLSERESKRLRERRLKEEPLSKDTSTVKPLSIKMSHKYPKLHGQTCGTLLSIETRLRSELPENFVEYDTVYDGGHFPLPDGKYMVLVFLGNNLIPFTTVRKWSEKNYQHFRNSIQCTFNIEFVNEDGTPREVS